MSADGDPLADLRQRIEALAEGGGAWRARLRDAADLLGEAAAGLSGDGGDATAVDLEAALEELGRALENLAGRLAELGAGPEGSEPGQRDRLSDLT